MPPAGFETTIPVSERPQTYAVGRAATGIGKIKFQDPIMVHLFFFHSFWLDSPQWARASSFKRFLDHTQRRITVRRTPFDKWSARRRDLYLTTYNIPKRQTSMPPVGFEPRISAGERQQTYALDRTATGTGSGTLIPVLFHDHRVYIINYRMLKAKERGDRLVADYCRRDIWKGIRKWCKCMFLSALGRQARNIRRTLEYRLAYIPLPYHTISSYVA